MVRKREIDRPLRSDVRSLGRILGEVLIEQEGEPLYALEERVRNLAILRRRGPAEERSARAAELTALLTELPLEQAIVIIRAFATYFRLVNLAEQNHRIRRTRAHARERDGRPQRGSLRAAMAAAREAGLSAEVVRHAIANLEVILTFTAHPTEAARRTILEKLYRIAHHLEERDRCSLTPQEIADGRAAIREEITALWQTDEVRRERPTVGDEVKNVLFYVEEILWDQMMRIRVEIERAFERVYGEKLGNVGSPLRLHSWVGGDMDGNPNVTPEVLEDSILAHQARGLRRLARALGELGGQLSQSDRYVRPPEALLASIAEDARRMPKIAAAQGPRTEGEPWRKKLRFVEARLAATIASIERRRMADPREGERPAYAPDQPYADPAELAADLELIANSLGQGRCAHSGERRARALFELVKTTGFGIAELEMRTVADDARNGAAWLAGKGERSPGAERLLSALERIARAQRELGDRSCRTLILSMTQDQNCVLSAFACARESGLWDAEKECARIDIVPLFETSAALEKSADVLRALFADPRYRKHLEGRGVQEVMVGYSDSGKEIGLLAASGALRRVQTALPAIAAKAGVPLRIFHGRGESVARGGGPAQQAILALPPGAVAGRFKVTEQGEALDHKYGRPELAQRTLELFIAGALLHTLGAQEQPPAANEKRYAEVFDELAEIGRVEYRALVWEEPLFFKYFTTATPIESISRLPIGSRPAKRGAGGVDALRAIPWVFAWTQNRAILPGWYGVGSALEKVGSRPDGAEILGEMYRRWPFFRAVIENVEMVVAKADMGIAERYADLAEPAAREAVWPKLRAEHARTVQWVKRIQGTRKLLEGNPALQRSIQLRNPYVDPM
ncbi:MAG: phosphoenolpyruvate carboxylase, partial [Myxococcales bacterium]|nr:phosphoenolpyruvate carboxylase [Myxococcales bacterium]